MCFDGICSYSLVELDISRLWVPKAMDTALRQELLFIDPFF